MMTALRNLAISFLRLGATTIILEELRRVLPKLVHRHGLTAREMDDLIDILALQSEVIEPFSSIDPDLRDNKDQPVLDALIHPLKTSDANYLITGDKDLLALSGRYRIVSPGDFWRSHGDLQSDNRFFPSWQSGKNLFQSGSSVRLQGGPAIFAHVLDPSFSLFRQTLWRHHSSTPKVKHSVRENSFFGQKPLWSDGS